MRLLFTDLQSRSIDRDILAGGGGEAIASSFVEEHIHVVLTLSLWQPTMVHLHSKFT